MEIEQNKKVQLIDKILDTQMKILKIKSIKIMKIYLFKYFPSKTSIYFVVREIFDNHFKRFEVTFPGD